MITEAEIYWITRLDGINVLFQVLCVIGAITTVLAIIFYTAVSKAEVCHCDEDNKMWAKWWKKWFKYTIPALIIGVVGICFVPTTKQYVAIKVIPMIVNNQKVQAISEKSLQLIEKTLDIKLKDMLKEEEQK